MAGYSAYWGVPDFGPLIRRQRIDAALTQGGRDIRVVSAPSGWGKTTAVAQYAKSTARQVLWVDCFGEPLDMALLRETVTRACSDRRNPAATEVGERHVDDGEIFRSLSATGDRVLLVIDDVAADREAIVALSCLQRRSLVGDAQTVMTTKSASVGWERFPGIALTGTPDLRLTLSEAEELARFLGPGAESSGGQQILSLCNGHIALYSLMACASQDESPLDSSPKIESWIHRLLEGGFTRAERTLLQRAALIHHGAIGDIAGDEVIGRTAFRELASRFPLFRIVEERSSVRFTLHDSAVEALLDTLIVEDSSVRQELVLGALETLAARNDVRRQVRVLQRVADPSMTAEWLKNACGDLFESISATDARLLIESLPVHSIMDSPALVLFWSQAMYASGDDLGAISKAKAACHLAEFSGEHDVLAAARIVWIDALCRMQRFDEAARLALSMVTTGSPTARCTAMTVRATVLMYVGNIAAAQDSLDAAQRARPETSEMTQDHLRLLHMEAVLHALRTGDYSTLVLRTSALLPKASAWASDQSRLRGNLGFALVETGRLERAVTVLDGVLESSPDAIRALYMVSKACALVALGHQEEGATLALEGLRVGYEAGLEADAAGNRIYVSMLARAIGDLDDALMHAERAFERYCALDYQGLRPLAAIEVAASLLALGDPVAARRWVSSVASEDLGTNAYHATRAAMVLAECDRREGMRDAGISRLAEMKAHIVSESSNWQIAMYVRAFPALLGMLAAAIGADALPVHMLRMVLPEFGEAALRESKPWLPPAEWRTLGQRVLGDIEFARTERRGAQPVCRVRLFGGLDVALADRVVAERDWRKRKARLLFAMLVARRGQEVPREQVLDYLWPELPEERARNNFYVAWSAMKSALMESANRSVKCPYLENKGGRLRIVSDTVRSDIDEFEDTLAEARDADAAGDSRKAIDAFSRLSSLYRGDLLPGDVYDDWFSTLRDRCRFDFVDAMLRAIAILLECDDPCEALVYARRAQGVDPTREDLYQAVMRCSIAAGQRNGAIDAFLQLRSKLADDLGLDPSAESMALYQQILVMEDRPRYDDFGLS